MKEHGSALITKRTTDGTAACLHELLNELRAKVGIFRAYVRPYCMRMAPKRVIRANRTVAIFME